MLATISQSLPVCRRSQLALLAVVFSCVVLPAWADEPADFTIVLLPDTQFYSETHPDTYVAQTEWIKQNAESKNIKFVIHLGDMVQNPGVESEWQNADRAHQVLDGAVSYSVLPGNHDMDPAVRDATLFNKYFPPKRFENCPWYGGHQGTGNENNYCLFEAAGMKFLVLSLAYHPTDETLKWAAGVLEAHPEHRAIVATHEYMARQGRRDVGQRLFDRLIRKHANVFMVVSGHVTGVGHQTSANDADGKVHEILCDYQGLPNGGSGWLATMRFVPAGNKIHVEAYSPLLDERKTEPPHTYTLDYDMVANPPAKAEEILETTGAR